MFRYLNPLISYTFSLAETFKMFHHKAQSLSNTVVFPHRVISEEYPKAPDLSPQAYCLNEPVKDKVELIL